MTRNKKVASKGKSTVKVAKRPPKGTTMKKKAIKKPAKQNKRKYQITVSDGRGSSYTFEDTSRNSIQHLKNHYGPEGGAWCIVRSKKGKVISSCRYADGFGYYHTFMKD